MNITEDNSARTVLVTMALLAAILGGLWFFGRDRGEQTTFRQTLHMTQLAQQLGTALHVAAQSEKQAVMAETDDESRRYAQEARSATDNVAALLGELKQLSLHAPQETELVARFEASFAEYLKVDEEVLGLAVQNTNLKAFALSFGKAAGTLGEMEKSLRPLLDGPGDKAARLAQRALAETLRIQSLHAAHILEKTDQRMDALEKNMAASDKAVRSSLALLGKEGAGALAVYERYWKLNAEIVSLSRQNTNVRSFTLSLERKTKVLAACDEALRAIEEKIRTRMVTR
jgi:hypothetical protein